MRVGRIRYAMYCMLACVDITCTCLYVTHAEIALRERNERFERCPVRFKDITDILVETMIC